MRNASGKAPTLAVWVICLVLFLLAVAANFGVIAVGAPILPWAWIIGLGLLVGACRVRGL